MTRRQVLAALGSAILLLCCIASLLAPAPESPKISPAPPQTGPTPPQFKKHMAQIKCERFVRDKLVSPSSAKFSQGKTYGVKDKPRNYHIVIGIVESQNRLGVMLQSKFRCDVHYLIDNPGEWVLDYLDIQD